PDDDVFFVASADGKKAYYSSVREDGMGYTDIFMITIPDGLKETAPVTTTTPKEPVVVLEVEEPKEEPKEQPEQPKEQPKPNIKPLHYVVKISDDTGKPTDAGVRLQRASDKVNVPLNKISTGVYEFTTTANTPNDYNLL